MENSEKLWTGKVPDNWKFYKGKYIFGERSERGNAINVQLLSTFKTIHRGDFCISLRSFQGGFEYSEYEGVVSPAYHVLFSKMDICAGYYKYLFKEQRFIAEMNSYCQSLRDGKNISYFDFGRTLIPFPPLSEQQSIADYLEVSTICHGKYFMSCREVQRYCHTLFLQCPDSFFINRSNLSLHRTQQ